MASGELTTELDPRYRILDIIGRGGMGIVYRVLDQVESRMVALKTLHEPRAQDQSPGEEPGEVADDLRRFDREIRALSLLNHPGIVQLHDVGRFGSRTYFTMELLRG